MWDTRHRCCVLTCRMLEVHRHLLHMLVVAAACWCAELQPHAASLTPASQAGQQDSNVGFGLSAYHRRCATCVLSLALPLRLLLLLLP